MRLPPMEFPETEATSAVVVKQRGEEDKLAAGLHKLHEEDPTFHFEYNSERSAAGALHQGHVGGRRRRLPQRLINGVPNHTDHRKFQFLEAGASGTVIAGNVGSLREAVLSSL